MGKSRLVANRLYESAFKWLFEFVICSAKQAITLASML
ncbi:hypothetical protein C8E01_10318 [Pontibacter virosus]|uniref:Uncharacterized protein n=1 Tax=Pontibacter virosus TaxID=1765052 RepID=A0A2U1B0J6_9BACT|nr:hypothetical protein C8E01_10318 [Pontibacter virosus]